MDEPGRPLTALFKATDRDHCRDDFFFRSVIMFGCTFEHERGRYTSDIPFPVSVGSEQLDALADIPTLEALLLTALNDKYNTLVSYTGWEDTFDFDLYRLGQSKLFKKPIFGAAKS